MKHLLRITAVAAALALVSCARMLPTAPEDPGAASPAPRASAAATVTTQAAGSATAEPVAAPGDPAEPVAASPGRIVTSPNFVRDPSLVIHIGPLTFDLSVLQLVLPLLGGHVTTPRWSLDIPAGALTQALPISIAKASDGTMKVEFGPDGTRFRKTVDLTIDYSGTSLDPSSPGYVPGSVPQFLWWDPARGAWVEMAGVNDPVHRRLHVKLQHFSRYGLAGGRAGW